MVAEAGVGVMQADSTFRLSLVAAVPSTVSQHMLYICTDSTFALTVTESLFSSHPLKGMLTHLLSVFASTAACGDASKTKQVIKQSAMLPHACGCHFFLLSCLCSMSCII